MISSPIKKTLSVLVVNHDGGQAVLNCLDALSNQNAPLEEIIVVDNASTDDSPTKIASMFPEVKVILLDDNLNLSKAHNVGLRETTSDLVLILDDDVYVDFDCIRHMYRAHVESSAAIICPRILLYPEKQIVQCDGGVPHFVGTLSLRHAYQPIGKLSTDAVEVPACIGACRLVDRKLLIESGGFDEEYFFYFEDLELSLRMRSLGHRIICEPKALVYHDRGSGTPQLSFRGQEAYPKRRFYINVRQRLMTILIHYKVRTLILLFPALLIYEIASLIASVHRGWIKSYLSAVSSLFKVHHHIASRRRFVMRSRKRPDRHLIDGGELPLAPGFLRRDRERRLVGLLSRGLDLYWKLARHHIG